MSSASNDVWTAMDYVPPRGKCNLKTSLMAPACSCLRFMLHPLKARSSFECDGYGQHASYHEMSNPAEESTIEKWATQGQGTQVSAIEPRKRKKLLPQIQMNADAGAGPS